MEVKIVTLAYNRPDFIELQLKSIKKWVKEFTFTVYDNAPDDSIKDECERLGIRCIPIKIFSEDSSWCVGLSLNKMWERMQIETGHVVYLDSDMFLVGKLPKMGDNHMAFVPQVRGQYTYPWTGLMMFNMDTLPHPEEMRWQVDYRLKDTDVGGLNDSYLKEHNPKVLKLHMWTVIDMDKFSYNGRDTKKKNRYHTYLQIVCMDKKFPRPYSVDMFNEGNHKPFVFHYKSASNYPDFYTEEYNRLKTNALKKLI